MGFHSFLSGREGVPETRYASLAGYRRDCWFPASPAGDWFSVDRSSGRRVWVLGTEGQARADGVDLDHPSRTRIAETDYPVRHLRSTVEPNRGSWQQPDHRFLVDLRRDADLLLRRLQHDSPTTPFSGPFTYATDALRRGPVPAELRGAIYQALVQLADVELIAETPDLDGHTRLALRWHSAHRDRDLLIDPNTGHFAGERDIITGDAGRLPVGTTAAATSVLTAVVNYPGDPPQSARAAVECPEPADSGLIAAAAVRRRRFHASQVHCDGARQRASFKLVLPR